MSDCIFCKIVKGDIPNYTVYEDEDVLSFLDIAPSSIGHSLVIPKQHIETMAELSDDLLAKVMLAVKKIAPRISDAVSADGYNIFTNTKPAAGQVVPHVHFHIVPRFKKDGIVFDWPNSELSGEQATDLLKKIGKIGF